MIVIVATLGFAASGPGYSHNGITSMSITPWLMFWKFVMGIGIGNAVCVQCARWHWLMKRRCGICSFNFCRYLDAIPSINAYDFTIATKRCYHYRVGSQAISRQNDGRRVPHAVRPQTIRYQVHLRGYANHLQLAC